MPEILIYGPIGMGIGVSAEDVKQQIDEANGAEIIVSINTGGGGFDEGLAIYYDLASYEGNVITEIVGIAYSMGALILQAGKVRRMAANSVVMVHGSQSSAEGSAKDLRQRADVMEVHTAAMISAFTKRGVQEAKIKEWLTDGEDHYFTAEQALEHGLIDEVSDAVDMVAAMAHIPKDIPLPRHLAAYRPQPEEIQMPDQTKAPETKPDSQAGTIDVTALKSSRDRNVQAGLQAGQQAEMRRQNQIRAFFDRPQFSDPSRIGEDNVRAFKDLLDACLGDCLVTADKARDAALDMQDGMPSPIVAIETQTQHAGSSFGKLEAPAGYRSTGHQSISAGADAKEKFVLGVTDALMVKAGVEKDQTKKRKAAENPFLSMSVYEMARYHNDLHGIAGQGIQRREAIIGAAITASGIAHSSSDFAGILENIANKAMMRGWDESPETWMNWARSGTLPDFKQGSRVNLSTFGDLDLIYENGEYKYGSFSDLKEVLTLGTFGKLFGISRQALANDDLSALSAVPTGMGRAAARKIGDLAYNSLLSNPVLNQDSTTVFHANHNNIGTAGLPSVVPGASVDEAWTAIGLQKDPAGNTLNISGHHILVPKALEISTTAMVADPFLTGEGLQNRSNPFQGRLLVTADARLDEASSTAWYVLADQNMHDTVEVAFLNGQETPYLESKEGWSTDGVEFKVRIDAVAVPLDFRTMFYNAGA